MYSALGIHQGMCRFVNCWEHNRQLFKNYNISFAPRVHVLHAIVTRFMLLHSSHWVRWAELVFEQNLPLLVELSISGEENITRSLP